MRHYSCYTRGHRIGNPLWINDQHTEFVKSCRRCWKSWLGKIVDQNGARKLKIEIIVEEGELIVDKTSTQGA